MVKANAINVSYFCRYLQVLLSFHIYKTYDCCVPVASYEEVWSESQTKEPVWLARYWAGFLACCCEWGLGWRGLRTSGKGDCKWLSAWKQGVWWWKAPEKLPVVCASMHDTHKIRRVVVESGEPYGWFMERQEDKLGEFIRMLYMVVKRGPQKIRRVVVESREHCGWFIE